MLLGELEQMNRLSKGKFRGEKVPNSIVGMLTRQPRPFPPPDETMEAFRCLSALALFLPACSYYLILCFPKVFHVQVDF